MVNQTPESFKSRSVFRQYQKKYDIDFLSNILNFIQAGVYIYDVEQKRCVFVNKQLCKIIKYDEFSLELFSADEFTELIHREDREVVTQYMENILRSSDAEEFEAEYRFKSRDGQWVWCLSKASVFERKADGSVQTIIGTILDITKKKELENHLKNQKTVLDISSIVTETNVDGKITYANDKFCNVSKYTREELIGNTHRIINSGIHSREFFSELWKTITSGNIWQGKICNKAKDGRYYWVDTVIVPFFDSDGKLYKYVSVRHEITFEKELQEQLKNQIQLAESAINSSNLKGEFICELSHEIRNALNSILGFAQVLDEYEMRAEQKDYLKRIHAASEHILKLLSNTLDASRLQSSKLTLDKSLIDIRSVLNEVADMVKISIKNKGLKFNLEIFDDVPSEIHGDRYRISQILLNLIGNAIKFTEHGGITLTLKKVKDSKDNKFYLCFSVRDTGRGIPKEKLKYVFKEFEQCSLKDSKCGSGLGLAISKKLVELMNGKIWVKSKYGIGTSIYFQIPL